MTVSEFFQLHSFLPSLGNLMHTWEIWEIFDHLPWVGKVICGSSHLQFYTKSSYPSEVDGSVGRALSFSHVGPRFESQCGHLWIR
jgi:hypothetical protein